MNVSFEGKQGTFAGIDTFYYEEGKGDPIIFIHGSGPGVSAWANWRLVLPRFSEKFHVLAPDLAGFGSIFLMQKFICSPNAATGFRSKKQNLFVEWLKTL